MNKIVIELCPEDRARLDAIISGLSGFSVNFDKSSITATGDGMELAAESVSINQHPVDAPTAHLEPPVADPEPAPAAKPVSLAEFQKAITVRCAESQKTKEAVRALVNQYASSVSDIPEDKRSEVLAKLSEI